MAGLISFVGILLHTILPFISYNFSNLVPFALWSPFYIAFLFCIRRGACGFQFLSYYIYGLSVSLVILFESEIHKLSFQPANPHPSFSSSDMFHVSRYSVMFTSLPPQGIHTMSSANTMDSGGYFLPHMSVHPWVWGTGVGSMHIVGATHIHVENVAFASCSSRTLVWQPQYNVLYQFNILFWNVALPHASPDLLHRYHIVCLGMKIASVELLLVMNPN